MDTGKVGNYQWIEFSENTLNWVASVIAAHKGSFLHITAFDGDPILPTEKEINEGWSSNRNVMVSPPLEPSLEIPYDNFDEWYFFSKKVDFDSDIEIFVNYDRFSVVPVEKQLKTFDPTWERDALDWLRPIQRRFWNQIRTLQPETYVSMGEKDIVVSKNSLLLETLRKNA